MASLTKYFLVYLLAMISASEVFASLSTLNINWTHRPLPTDLGVINAGSNISIVWDVSEDPDNLTLSILLKRNTTSNSVVAGIIATGSVPNNGSFLWDVQDSFVSGGGYYIRLQTGNSSDWGNGTNNSPPTLGDVYGLAGFFTIDSQSNSPTASSTTTTSSPTSAPLGTPSAAPPSAHPGTPSAAHPSAHPGTPSAAHPSARPGTPSAAHPSAHPGTPSAAHPSAHPGTPSAAHPGTPSAAHPGTPSAAHPGTPSAAHPSAHPGTPSAAHPGTPSAAHPSAHPGTPSAAHPGTPSAAHPSAHPGTPSAAHPSAHPGTPSAAPPSAHPGTPSAAHPSAHPGTPSAAHPSARPGTPSAAHPSAHPGTPSAAHPSAHPGTPSAAHPGTPSAAHPSARPGTPSAAHPSAHPGTPSAAHPSARPGTPSAAHPSAHPGTPSAAHPSARPGTPSAAHPSAHPGTPSAAHPSAHPGTPSAAHPSAHPGTPSAAHPSAHPGTPSAAHPGTPSAAHPSAPPGTPSAAHPSAHPGTPSAAPPSAPPTTSTPAIPSPGTTQILSTLPINWSVSSLNGSLGSIIAGTNVNIVWNSSRNSDNLPLSVILKQGNSSEGGRVVSIPASKNVPNNGLFAWHVEPSLPPGSGYYIRVQTGTSDDWDGGLDTSAPTPGAIYGLAGFFTINSTFGGSAAAATVVATQFVTCCRPSSRESGIIAGSVLGGIIALGFLAAVGWFAPTWFATKQKPPVPGANRAENRRFRFEIPPLGPEETVVLAFGGRRTREGIDPAQLTLILKPDRFPDIKPIAWQVFTIDGRRPSFSATLPLDRGFGDVRIEEDPNSIAGILHARIDQNRRFVPPGWVTTVGYELETGLLSFEEPSNFSTKRPNHIAIENRTEVPQSFTLGTYHETHDEDEDERPFQPFAMAESVKEKLVVPHALNLQIYLTYNVRVGQVMTDDLLQTPLLRPVGGIKVADLAPGSVTTWTVRGEGPGQISLERQ